MSGWCNSKFCRFLGRWGWWGVPVVVLLTTAPQCSVSWTINRKEISVENESTVSADASVEASYNVAFKKKPGDKSSDSSSYNVQRG